MSATAPTTATASASWSARDTRRARLDDSTELAGRVLLSALFLSSGVGKISAYAATAGYMAAMGVPAAVLPVVIAFEILGSAALILGWRTRITAFLLAGFSLLTALLFHNDFGDQMQMIMFMKNVSIAGGFLLLTARGAGRFSIDARRAR